VHSRPVRRGLAVAAVATIRQSFNQGTPKPDGTLPSPTTPLSGTYDPATRQFTLQWKSLIVGGPFNGFTGLWRLGGTFVPSQSAGGGVLPR
jgi:hypothetical protein